MLEEHQATNKKRRLAIATADPASVLLYGSQGAAYGLYRWQAQVEAEQISKTLSSNLVKVTQMGSGVAVSSDPAKPWRHW